MEDYSAYTDEELIMRIHNDKMTMVTTMKSWTIYWKSISRLCVKDECTLPDRR